MGDDKKTVSFEKEDFREWLIGADAKIQIEVYLEGNKDQVAKDHFIEKMLEIYESRMNQELRYFDN